MTRINSAMPPSALSDKHLLTEHREILRMVHNWRIGRLDHIPPKFVFGKGHVKFFINKQKFIYHRYLALYHECLNRNYRVTDWSQLWKNSMADMIANDCWNDHVPTQEEYDLQVKRLDEKVRTQHHNYHRVQINDYINDVLIKHNYLNQIYGQH